LKGLVFALFKVLFFSSFQVLSAAGNSVAQYQDRQTMTMLHLAAIFNNAPIADLLLASGADPTVKNSEGESAIDVAQPTLKLKMKQVRNCQNA
jgi:ankyrin repeat protein